jgi:5-methylcytosine-specific restriction endonuclease McrA
MGVRKQRVPRTRNAGTMTEASFWAGIRSALRQKSRWWKPIAEAKKLARRAYTGKNKRQKWEYKCAHCKQYFKEKEINVDHIKAAGSLRNYSDLPGFVERLFCEVEGLQVLCTPCHNIKTQKDKKK